MRLRGLTAVHMPPPQPRQLSPGEVPARGSDGDARREGAEVSQGQAPGIRGHGNPQPTLPDQGAGPAKTERGTFKVFLPLTALWLVKRKKKANEVWPRLQLRFHSKGGRICSILGQSLLTEQEAFNCCFKP